MRIAASAAVLSVLTMVSPILSADVGAAPGATVDVIVALDEAHAPGGHAANQRRAAEIARSHGLVPEHTYGSALFGFSAAVPQARMQGLQRDPRVAYVTADGTVHATGYPTGVRRIDADDVHAGIDGVVATGEGIRVAVLDTGIDRDHPGLPNVVNGVDCVNGGDVADDDHGHGTHVAGTVGAAVSSSVTGVAPDVTLVPVKVLSGSGGGSWASVICGIDWVAQQGIPVANMSLGGAASFSGLACGSSGDALFEAICGGVEAGVTFTVSAGNNSRDASGSVPASHPLVITVSAFSDTDGVANGKTTCTGPRARQTCDESFASFSNYGTAVDVIAPGVSIESTTYDGKTGTKSGTSMAAPHVAGVVALVLERSPGLTPAEVKAHLLATGQCPDGKQNPGTGVCVGQAWHNDPDGIAEPMVNARFAVQGSSSPGDDLEEPLPEPEPEPDPEPCRPRGKSGKC